MAETTGQWATGHAIGLGLGVGIGAAFGERASIPAGRGFMKTVMKRGALESMGFYQSSGINKGFMGLGKGFGAEKAGRAGSKVLAKGAFGKTVGRLGKAGGLLYTGYEAYAGYQREGVWGAVKGVAESIVYSSAYHAGTAIMGTAVATAVTVAAGVVATAVGLYAFGEAAQAHHKRMTGLEFGSPSVDMLNGAGALTSRARAMNALHSTHINARIAIGNEALLGHTSYRR